MAPFLLESCRIVVEPDDQVCLCFHVSKRKIVNYIRIHKPRVPSQISECASAGTGCGWCIPFLKRYFEQETGRDAGVTGSDLSAEEYAQKRAAYIKDGGGTPPPGAEPLPDE
jgi:NAD(P)H-nitrite reductase large subunit